MKTLQIESILDMAIIGDEAEPLDDLEAEAAVLERLEVLVCPDGRVLRLPQGLPVMSIHDQRVLA